MKLLKISTVPLTLEAFFRPFAEHFRIRGWTVDAAAREISSSSLCVESFSSCFDLPFNRNPIKNNILSICQQIRALVKEQEYDLIHVHTPNAAFLVRFALRNRPPFSPAIVYTAHGFHYNPERRRTLVYWWLEKLAARWTDHLIVVNNDDYELALSRRLISESKLTLIPSAIGLDLQKYNRKQYTNSVRRKVRQDLGIPEHAPVFLKLAEFIPRKRHADALNAFARLPSSAYLLLAGSGPLESTIKNLATTLGIDSRVRFLGFRRDVAELLIAADAVILLSEREGLPRSLMEAMALETPIIGTDVKGTRELVKDAGFMVPLGDVDAISQTMRLIIDKPDLAKTKVLLGLSNVQQFSLEGILETHERLYISLRNKQRQSLQAR